MYYVNLVIDYIKKIFYWVLDHKVLVFIKVPLILFFLLSVYTGYVYFSWTSDKVQALDKMARYKKLIDRTEEMKEGLAYSESDVDLKKKVVDIPTRIYDVNGEIIGEFFDQKREIVPFSQIPKSLINAVISSEDRDFYQHAGVNPKGIARAMVVNIFKLSVSQGGSTITQQLAKVLFTDMDRSIKRKIYEMFCALEIERRYDKQDILSMYLNLIYFGNGSYGVESTSKMFFGMPVKDLNEAECSMIVATISNPLYYSPISNLKNSSVKTKRIMKSMVDAGYLKEAKSDYLYKQFLKKWDVTFDDKNAAQKSLIGSFMLSMYKINRAPFFNETVRRILVSKFGEEIVKKGGLSVHTTIDARKQDVARAALIDGIREQREYFARLIAKGAVSKKQDPNPSATDIEGALIAVNPNTGEIIAYEGGYEFNARKQLDHVSQIKRQPGSSFKPLVYCAAIQDKDISPSTVFVDEKKKFKGNYSPANYSGTYSGKVIVREALVRSINTIAVQVLVKSGYGTVFDYIKESLDMPAGEFKYRFMDTPSLALGTYEVSPLENAVLHSVIVNGGDFIKPYGIKYVKDYNGNIVWNNEEETAKLIEKKREEFGKIIDPNAAAITVNMLKGVMKKGGTAGDYKLPFPVAGKTGTSTNWNDAWFVGYTSDLVTAVWIGNEKGAISLGRGRSGGSISAPVWGRFIAKIYNEKKPADFRFPEEGITKERICLDSGMVASKENYCPSVSEEYYLTGSEPGEYCTLHKSADMSVSTEKPKEE